MKDRWSQLSMSEKSDLMSLYIRNGISSLEEIKKHYNSYQDGGRISFQQWKAMMKSKYPDIKMDNNKAGYNYEEYFNNHYDDAIKQLSNLQHFPDTYKLPNHPTFSNESIYSRGPIIGGSWINDSTFTPSVINKQYYPNIYKEDRNYTEREIYQNRYATGGQMHTDGPDDPEEDKIYTAHPLNEVQIIGHRNPAQTDVLQQHLDNVNSFYYNDVVPRLQREHRGLKTKPDINFPYLNIEDIDFNPKLSDEDKTDAYVNPILPSKVHSYVTPEDRYFDEDMAHENSHRWQFEYPKRDKQYKDKSKEMLRQAYGNYTNKFRNTYKSLPAFIVFGPSRTMINDEYEADNRAVRYNIWRDYRDLYHRTPTIEELDKYIDEIPALDLYKKYIKPSGYLDVYSKPPAKKDERYRDFYKSKMEDFEENVQKVREALKHVAQNNTTEDTVHYAALGGHLYQEGGPNNLKKKPKFKQSEEQYYDRNNDIIYAQDSIGEGYQHEYFHARPNTTLLNNLRPYYENLNDNRLIELGADLPFVKRLENDPNHFYSPEEIGARVSAARYMLEKAGVKNIDAEFLKNARLNELKYGDNFRDLLHMYNDENLLNIFNGQYQKGGSLGKVTPYGQWEYPHQVTTIPSNNITMKGVDYPVLGISDTGDTKYMLPNMDYLFDGNYVTEYPLHKFQRGGNTDGISSGR